MRASDSGSCALGWTFSHSNRWNGSNDSDVHIPITVLLQIKLISEDSVDAGDIDAVILSHVHYDHHGDPEDFEQSIFLVGPGSKGVLKYGAAGQGSHQSFDSTLLPQDRTVEFPGVGPEYEDPDGTLMPDQSRRQWYWKSVGPFPAGIDLFGDRSVYVINAPGHLPGHINLLCRTGPNKWVSKSWSKLFLDSGRISKDFLLSNSSLWASLWVLKLMKAPCL